MSGKKPPSKPVLIAAILPFPIAVVGLFAFVHFNIPAGFIATVVALVAYYIVFGIVFAVFKLKEDEKRAKDLGDLTLGKYVNLTMAYANATTEEEMAEAAERLELAMQREVEETASKKKKVGTIIFMVLTFIIVAAAFIFYALDMETVTFICIGAFVGLVFLVVIIIACSSHVRTRPPKSADKTGEGKVLACAACISISILSGLSRSGAEYKTKSNYKVVLIMDGRSMYAYSHERYFHGEKVKVAYSDKSDKCYII
ncbi:MAG: hypothetical protein K2O28_06820 [Clostridia bacterium]|nr:hypothetical protein [Clostridia bacterium]